MFHLMSNYYEKMKFEMELRGYSPHTKKHYLSHVRLLESFCNKPLDKISPDEIKQYIIDNVHNLKHKVILLTTYSSGLRISEVLNLSISDIDSKNMLIRVRCGKGG